MHEMEEEEIFYQRVFAKNQKWEDSLIIYDYCKEIKWRKVLVDIWS